jgi:hypothetical protein
MHLEGQRAPSHLLPAPMSDTVDHLITLYDVDGKKRPYSPYVMKTRYAVRNHL